MSGDTTPKSSPLASLRDRVEQARQRATTDLGIAGLDGVVVRYRALDYDTVEKLLKKRAKESGLASDISALARACIGIFIDVDGDLVSIDEDGDGRIDADGQAVGTPVTFSSDRLAQLLGLETPARPAETVPAMFPLEMNISEHAAHIANFSRGEAGAVARSALGN